MMARSSIPAPVLATFMVIVLLLGGCTSQSTAPTGKQRRKSIETIQKWMTGTFQNSQQSKHAPEAYHDIRLVQVPIWKFLDDGPWLYVEQARAGDLDRPYRQRVYRLDIQADGSVATHVYGLPGNPLDYTAPWRGDGSLGGLHPDSLVPRSGCTVVFEKVDGNTFTGGIEGKGCPSTLDGAAYLTSDVTLRSDRILIWDRGYDSDGKQVWGSTEGPYIFRRVSSSGPE